MAEESSRRETQGFDLWGLLGWGETKKPEGKKYSKLEKQEKSDVIEKKRNNY